MKVALAGGSGFIGRATRAALRDAGHDVIVISRTPGEGGIACDVGAEAPPPEALADCDAVINLVGIAFPKGENTFERAHLDAVRNLLEASGQAGVRRFIHVSVVDVPGADGEYFSSKRQGEQLVTQSDREFTIVRPGLVYGPGDGMMTNLVRLIRVAPVFAVPGGPPGPLQVVDVRDVALAIIAALEDAASIGKTYDVVGPEQLSLRELVARVAEALGLAVWAPALPVSLMKIGAWLSETLLPTPLVSRSQLQMLRIGLYGNPAAAREELGVIPRRLTAERIVELAGAVKRWPSVRLVGSREAGHFVAEASIAGRSLSWYPALAVVALLASPWLIEDLWTRMLAVNVLLAAVGIAAVRIPWRRLLRPAGWHFGVGLAVAAGLFAAGKLVLWGGTAVAPDVFGRLAEVYAWFDDAPTLLPVYMVAIVAAEDVVWRGTVTMPLAAKLGPWLGGLAAGLLFGASHFTTGPPVLVLAAVLAGTFWSWLAVRTRSLVPVITCHLAFDVAMML